MLVCRVLCDVTEACGVVDDVLEAEDGEECDEVVLVGDPVFTVTEAGWVLAGGVPVMEGGPK
jgi:hypothetical protein